MAIPVGERLRPVIAINRLAMMWRSGTTGHSSTNVAGCHCWRPTSTSPPPYPTWTDPAPYTLHVGNFSSDGAIVVTVLRHHSADSPLSVEVLEAPQPGQIRVLLDFDCNSKLLHLATGVFAAALGISKKGNRNPRVEIVGEGAGESGAGKVGLAAAALMV